METILQIKRILEERQLAPSKRLGQNFLVSPQTAEKIASFAGSGPVETVIELGVGFGSLTKPLARRARQVIGLEIDAGIIRWHEETGDLPGNVELIHQDLLRADFGALAARAGGRLKIMANLPYSVSNPLLFKLLDYRESMEWAVLMLQKEVAERLTARVGTKEYGILSVLLAACASVEPLLRLGPEQFHPRPKIDSMVVRLTFAPLPERVRQLPLYNFQLLKKVVKSAFQQRRKTLLNSLSSAFPAFGKEEWRRLLAAAEVAPEIRAERLTLEEYVRLTNVLDGASSLPPDDSTGK